MFDDNIKDYMLILKINMQNMSFEGDFFSTRIVNPVFQSLVTKGWEALYINTFT